MRLQLQVQPTSHPQRGPTRGNLRPAVISSIAFFDKTLIAPCTIAASSTEFPKNPAPEIFRQICPVKAPLTGIYVGKGDPVAYRQKTAGRVKRWQLTVAKRLYCSEFPEVPIKYEFLNE